MGDRTEKKQDAPSGDRARAPAPSRRRSGPRNSIREIADRHAAATATTSSSSAAEAIVLSGPVVLDVAGDRFEIEVRLAEGKPSVRIQYVGPERSAVDDVIGARHVTSRVVELELRTGGGAPASWDRPFNIQQLAPARDAVGFDLYGDGSALLEVTDKDGGSTIEARKHSMMVTVNRIWAVHRIPTFEIELPDAVAGDSAAARKPDPTGRRAVIVPLDLNGDRFELGARRFGTTQDMLLSLRGGGQHSSLRVPVAGELRSPGLKILTNNGRDISIDLDGAPGEEAWLIHTVLAGPKDRFREDGEWVVEDLGEQRRVHHLDVYDRSAIRAGVLIGQATGYPRHIPPEQDRIKNPPPQSQPTPLDRAPVQGDVPAEHARAIKHASEDWELRFDGNGDRRKELLLRIVPGDPAAYDQPRTYKLSFIRVDIQTSDSLELALTPEQRSWFDTFGPRQTAMTDGLSPIEITLVPKDKPGALAIELDPRVGGYGFDVVVQPGGARHSLLVDAGAEEGKLTDTEPGAATENIAAIKTLEMTLGEYGDRFRFTVEEAPSLSNNVIFAVTAVGPGPNVAGYGYELLGRMHPYLELRSVGASNLWFDTMNLTRPLLPDLEVRDTMSAPMDRPAYDPGERDMPSRDRDHRIQITDRTSGYGTPVARQSDPFTFKIRGGQLVSGYLDTGKDPSTTQRYAAGAGQAVGILKDLAERTDLLTNQLEMESTRFGAAMAELLKTKHGAPKHEGGTEAARAWRQLHEDMIYIAAHRHDPARDVGQDGDEPKLSHRESAMAATRVVLEWLRRATTQVQIAPEYETQNPFTGEAMRKSYGSAPRQLQPAHGVRLLGDLDTSHYAKAVESYRDMADGLYLWVEDQLKKEHGADSAEVKQLAYMREREIRLREIAEHPGAFRVPAAFIADSSYSQEKDYARYRTIPMDLWVWREGSTWHLRDLTRSADKPWKASVSTTDLEGPPPQELFEKLNHKRNYPKGLIRYYIPDVLGGHGRDLWGHGSSVVCTEPKTWADHLRDLGLALAVIGLAASLAGFGVVAIVAFAASAIANIAADVVELADAHEHGYLDGKLIFVNIVDIVVNLATLGTLSAGKTITSAAMADRAGLAWKGTAAHFAGVAQRVYKPLVGTQVAGNATQLIVMSVELKQQLEQIERTLPAGEQMGAKARLVAQFVMLGGLQVLSIRGDLPQVWRKAPLVLDHVNGVPVIRAADVEIGDQIAKLDKASTNAHATARWSSDALKTAGPGDTTAQIILANKTNRAAFAAWMGNERKLDRNGRVIAPKGASPELVIQLQKFADATDLKTYERAFAAADEATKVGAKEARLDLDPSAPGWSGPHGVREQLVRRLGGDASARRLVAVYERARLGTGVEDLSGFMAQRAAITRVIPDAELDSIRHAYPDAEVYVTGNLARGGAPHQVGAPVEIVVVAPPGTPNELMGAMERRLEQRTVRLQRGYLEQRGASASAGVGVRVKVVTAEQFFGLSITPGAGRFHKLDSTMPEMLGGRVRPLGDNVYAADAADLIDVHAAWKARGGAERVSPVRYDPATNTSHFDLQIGRGGAKQQIRITAHVAKRITTATELVESTNAVIGAPVRGLAEGHDLLRQLGRGNLAALGDPKIGVGVEIPAGTKLPADVELGLGRTSDGKYVVIRGEGGAVDWARLPGVTPVGHTHPDVPGNDLLPDATQQKRVAVVELTQPKLEAAASTGAAPKEVPLLNRELVFASVPDIGLMARRGIEGHRVHTSFIVRDGYVMKAPPGDTTSPRLEFVIAEPREVGTLGKDGDPVYRAVLVGEVDGRAVIRVEVWGNEARTIADSHLYLRPPPELVLHEAPPVSKARPTSDGLPPGETFYTVRVKLEDKVRAELDALPQRPDVRAIGADEFFDRFGSESGRSVFVIEDGAGVIYARPDARRIDLLDELQHARQMQRETLAAEIHRLHGAIDPGTWKQLSVRDRIGIFRRKLEIEIDAKQRTLREARQARDPDAEEVADTLAELRRLQKEVEGFSDRDLAMMSADPRGAPQYLDDPAWLFSKGKKLRGQRQDREAITKHTTITALPRDTAERSAAFTNLEGVVGVSRVGDEWSELLHVTSDQGGTVTRIEGTRAKGQTIVITKGGKEHVYALEPNADVRVQEGQTVRTGQQLAIESDRRYRLVRIDYKNGTSELREEIKKLDGTGWVQRGSESTRRGGIMETAAKMQIDARMAELGVAGRRIDHHRGGGGFDDVIVTFSETSRGPKAKIFIREVKDYPHDYVPLEEFTAIRPPGLGANLDILNGMVDGAIAALKRGEAVSESFKGMTPRQLNAIKAAIRNNDIQIDIVLGPTTKLGSESAKGSSVLRDLRAEIKRSRGGNDLLAGRKGTYDPDAERVQEKFASAALAAEKKKPP